MAGFPNAGKSTEIGHNSRNPPFPFPCLRSYFHNKGPGRNKLSGKFQCQSRMLKRHALHFNATEENK